MFAPESGWLEDEFPFLLGEVSPFGINTCFLNGLAIPPFGDSFLRMLNSLPVEVTFLLLFFFLPGDSSPCAWVD